MCAIFKRKGRQLCYFAEEMIASSKQPKFLYISSIVTLGVGLIVLFGWFLGSEVITQLIPGMPSMKFNTALCFVLLGASSLFFSFPKKINRSIGGTLIGIGLIISFLTLFEHILGQNLGIDELFFPDFIQEDDKSHPGRMSAATAICFILCFLPLASMPFKKMKKVQAAAQITLHITILIASVSVFSYLLFVPTSARLTVFESMAIHTSLSFLLYSISLSFIQTEFGFFSLFTGKKKGDRLARILFFRILVLIILLSGIQLLILHYKFINTAFSIALFGVVFVWICLALVRSMSNAINKVDSAKMLVEKDLQKSKSFLEAIAASLFVVDLSGNIQDQNQNALTQFGYSVGELEKKPISTLIPQLFGIDVRSPTEAFLDAFKTSNHHIQSRQVAVRKNGEEFYASTLVSQAMFDGENYLIVNLQDLTAHEALESQLNLNVEKLNTAVEFFQIGFWEYDVLLNNLSWGKSMYNVYNLKMEDFTGDFEAWERSLHPEDLPIANQEFAKALSGEKDFNTSFRVIGSDGQIRHIRAKAKVFHNDEGKPIRVLGTNWDITKEKEAELAIEKSNERLQIFIEQAPSAIAMFDTQMRYLSASQRWISDYGLEGRKILGVSHYTVFPEIGDDWKEIHRACLAGAISAVDEAEFKREDGSTQWLSWDVRPWYTLEGEIGGIIMNTANITAQKENIRQRLQVENILDKTNQIARTGTWEMDLIHNTVIWSKMVKQIHEVPDDFIPELASGISFYKEGLSRDAITKAVTKCVETGQPFDLELELVTAKGNGIWVRAIGDSDTGASNPSKIFGIFQDITERKKDELALNYMLTISNDQNERLRNYAHIVSHNLRSHSGNINMMLELIAETHPTWTEEEMFQMLQVSSSQLRDTITHLNEVVAIGGTVDENLLQINLRKSIDACIGQISGTAIDAKVEIQNLVDENISILGLAAYVDSMLINLISNGIKYRSNEVKSFVRIDARHVDNHVEITVEDNGIGIDLKRHGDKLFGMYKTFHGNKDARGIGLFITKNQIEAMGGSIHVASIPNKGTTFTITLTYGEN